MKPRAPRSLNHPDLSLVQQVIAASPVPTTGSTNRSYFELVTRHGVSPIKAARLLGLNTPAPGIGGLTFKWDEAQHPRDTDGRFIEATAPRVFNTPDEIVEETGWGTSSWRWKDKETGKPSGMLLTGTPLTREQLPPTLYHVTTNAPAVEESGVLLGQRNAGAGLGGGQAQGVSFTTSSTDAKVIQRELVRAVRIAHNLDYGMAAIEQYAREDEKEAGLSAGTLQPAVEYAREGWEGNKHILDHTFQWDMTKPEGERGYRGPAPVGAELERLKASLTKDALNAYLQTRERQAEKHVYEPGVLKNPLLMGDQKFLKLVDPKWIQTLKIPSSQIPPNALVTTGSDNFLHEVRAYSDVPLPRFGVRKL